MGRGGGGGRSSGGGGGRSSGGRSSSSSSRSRSSSSGYSRSRSSSGSFNFGNSRNRSGGNYYRGGGNFRGGCASLITAFIVMVVVALAVLTIFLYEGKTPFSDSNDITKSTVVREALPAGSVVETDYYTDAIGDWIHNSTTLTTGMRNFYKATGVQPYLYIADSLGDNISPNDEEATAWMNNFYDATFDDEAHTLLLFFERNSQYSIWYLNGKQAKVVMDTEAMDILMDYVELYYYSNMTEDEMFSTAYDRAATRIMEVTKAPLPWYAPLLILIAIIIIILIIFNIWKAKKAQKNIEDENTRRILETPLENLQPQPYQPRAPAPGAGPINTAPATPEPQGGDNPPQE